MKTSKRIIGTILGVFLGLFGSVSLFSGCKAEDEDKKYDVTIKIASDDGDEWIFTPDIQEMHTTREYDGQEHRFYVKEYQLADHPRWSDEWFAPASGGANIFQADFLYTDLEGKQSTLRRLKDRGKYVFCCSADATSDLWNFRSIYLYITVV